MKERAWLEPGLAVLRKKVNENWTEKSIAMWPERSSWKEVGRKRDYSTLAGRISVNVKLARWWKAQRSTGSTTAQSGMKADGKFQRPSKSWSKKQEPQKKEWKWQRGIVLHPLSESQWNRGHFSMRKWVSVKHKKLVYTSRRFQGPRCH